MKIIQAQPVASSSLVHLHPQVQVWKPNHRATLTGPAENMITRTVGAFVRLVASQFIGGASVHDIASDNTKGKLFCAFLDTWHRPCQPQQTSNSTTHEAPWTLPKEAHPPSSVSHQSSAMQFSHTSTARRSQTTSFSCASSRVERA